MGSHIDLGDFQLHADFHFKKVKESGGGGAEDIQLLD